MSDQIPNRTGVVVLNYNGWEDTLECLESLAGAAPGPDRVVVVDNSSTDGSLDHIRAWGRRHDLPLTTIAAERNLGFAGGSNLGLAELVRDRSLTHFLLLNNDATVEPDFFAELARAVHQRPDAGLVTCTIFVAGTRQVWAAGGRILPARALAVHDHELPVDDHPVPTEFATGCALLVSRAAYRTLGPLPECYFPLYMEDVEFSFRAGQRGLPVLYAPRAKAHHKVGATVGPPRLSPLITFCQNRHRGFFVRRNLRGWHRILALGYLGFTKPGRALLELVSGRPRIALAVIRGTVAGLFSPGVRQ